MRLAKQMLREEKSKMPEMPEKKLTVSASPHVRSAQTVSGIMLNVIIALIPALAASVWLFGPRVLLICLVTIGTCMLSGICRAKS